MRVAGIRELGAARRTLVVAALSVAAGVTAVIALSHSGGTEDEHPADWRPAAADPNVVVIMTDDQSVEHMAALPRTRRQIGAQGVTFRDFYVTDPLCCPSRATFLTGQYAHNHGVISNGGPNAYPALRQRDTLAVWLRRAGYRTIFVGKYLNGYGLRDPRVVPPGWSEWRALVEPSTQSYFDYEINENGSLRRYGTLPADYKTRVLGDHAVASIRRAARSHRPFFAYVGFNAPHAPSTPAPADEGAYAGVPAPRSPAFDEVDVSDKPRFIRDRPRLDPHALARIDARNERALESLRAVDREVARIVSELRRRAALENTYVLFTSDNGYLDGEHRIEFGKLLPYRASSRVPLLVRGPGIPRGAKSDALVGNIDLAPTIAAIAGATPTLEPDGRSLLGLATDPDHPDDRPLLIESLVRDRSTYYGHPYRAIRTGRYLYVEHSTGDEELYDLRRDPNELESRAADPAYAGMRQALGTALSRLRDCVGDDCGMQLPAVPAASGGRR